MKKKIAGSLFLILIFLFGVSCARKPILTEGTLHQRGLLALAENNIERAEQFFKQSASDLSYAPSYFELAKIEFDKNTIRSRRNARNYLQSAIWKEPENIEYRLLMANIMSFLSKGMAYNVYEEILEINPACVEALYNMGKIKEEEFYEYHKSFRRTDSGPSFSLDSYAYDYFSAAERFFRKVIKYDPQNIDTYLHLSFLYEAIGEFEEGIRLLKKVTEIDPENKNAFLFLGLLYNKIALHDSALVAYQKALELMNEEDKDDFVFKSAKLLFVEDDQNSLMFGRKLNTFWNANDPLYLTDYNERLLEHYSRVALANLRFTVEKLELPGWQSDRGEILVRYGEPYERIRFRPSINAGGRTTVMLKTDLWLYRDKVFGFTDDYWTNNYRFSVPNNSGRYLSQFNFDTHSYNKSLKRTNPEDYSPKFKGNLFNVPFNLVQFKDLDNAANKNTQLYLNYALDVFGSFKFRGNYKLQHKAGLFLLDDEANKIKQTVDNYTYLNSERELNLGRHNKFWISSMMMETKPDSGTIAFEIIRDKDNGVSTNRFGLRIKEFSENKLDLSDILLASEINRNSSGDGAVIRRDLTILPNPTHTFTCDNNIFIYYEVYNLAQNSSIQANFEQRITISKKEESSGFENFISSLLSLFGTDRGSDRLTMTTNYQSFKKNTQVYLQLDMKALEAGEYIVEIKVKDKSTGEEASSETFLVWR